MYEWVQLTPFNMHLRCLDWQMPVLKVSREACLELYLCKKERNSLSRLPPLWLRILIEFTLVTPHTVRGRLSLLLSFFFLPFFFVASGEAVTA